MILDVLRTFLVENCPWVPLIRLSYSSGLVYIKFAHSIIKTDIPPDDNIPRDYSFYTFQNLNSAGLNANLEVSVKNPNFFKTIITTYKWFGMYGEYNLFIYLNSLCNRSDPLIFTLNGNNIEIKESGIYYNTKRLYTPSYNLNKLQKYLYRDSTKLTNIIRYCLVNSVI